MRLASRAYEFCIAEGLVFGVRARTRHRAAPAAADEVRSPGPKKRPRKMTPVKRLAKAAAKPKSGSSSLKMHDDDGMP